uniref:Uncharacterized protein n=1 Tax=Ditylenchus dipsaci TaxID=166011 RepID=A0A915DZN1_9BILA
MQWTLSPKPLAMPSTRCLLSLSVFCLVALQLLSFSTTQISALPNPNNNKYYALFREESAQASPYYRLFAPGNEEVSQEKRDVPMAIGKKYDRNCFFSPVQCMLSFNKNAGTEDTVWKKK